MLDIGGETHDDGRRQKLPSSSFVAVAVLLDGDTKTWLLVSRMRQDVAMAMAA
jgi:hypothetical protein